MSQSLRLGVVDQSVTFGVYDADGAPVTSRTHANFTATYLRLLNGVPLMGSAQSISLSALGTVNATHEDGGVIHIGGGKYRMDLLDAVTLSGASAVIIAITSDESGDTVVIDSVIPMDAITGKLPSGNIAGVGDVTSSIVSFNAGQQSYLDGGTIRVGQTEGRTITITHSGLDLTGATLRFTVYLATGTTTKSGVFELEGADVVGGNGATTVDLSATETEDVLGEGHYWNLWEAPDDAEDSLLHASGKFRVALACHDVS